MNIINVFKLFFKIGNTFTYKHNKIFISQKKKHNKIFYIPNFMSDYNSLKLSKKKSDYNIA